MQWMVDFDVAEAKGSMALRIRSRPRARGGLDSLFVLGVAASAAPQDVADEVALSSMRIITPTVSSSCISARRPTTRRSSRRISKRRSHA
jgi:hypothetical protein